MFTGCIDEIVKQVHHELHSKIKRQVNLHFDTNINPRLFEVIACSINGLNLVDLWLRQQVEFRRIITT